MATVLETQLTPDDLLRMPDDGRVYELVDGRLVEKNIGTESSWIGGQIHVRLNREQERGAGWALPAETGYTCFPDDLRKVRKPDASFIRYGRLTGERLPRGFCSIAPDIAAEVVSPNDLFSEVEDKVAEYLEAGVKLVWVANPDRRTIHVYRADGTISLLHEDDELTGEDVLPDFRCRVGDLFPPREATDASQ
jgi:Uma2 family endonuclease